MTIRESFVIRWLRTVDQESSGNSIIEIEHVQSGERTRVETFEQAAEAMESWPGGHAFESGTDGIHEAFAAANVESANRTAQTNSNQRGFTGSSRRHASKAKKVSLQIGQQIGHYRLKELLGVGGMGEVFLAQDVTLGRLVAIKILDSVVAAERDRVCRFVQEARAASSLSHPNILTIHDAGVCRGARYIVSEYVRGETVSDRLTRTPLRIDESVKIAIQVAAALQAAHEAGIIHRDIKPENIMLRADGLVKVLDFGLAKLTNQRRNVTNASASTLAQVRTDPGIVMGTVAYMSPEQARGVAVDARTDIWSLGVVLYEMLSGKLPFPGDTTSDIIAAILKSEAQPLDDLDIRIPRELQSVCFKSLRKDLGDRYQTANEFSQDLLKVTGRLESSMKQQSPQPGLDAADYRNDGERSSNSGIFSQKYLATSIPVTEGVFTG